MRVGIPKGLLYYKYNVFIENFFAELGADIIISADTNKDILDRGVRYCVDEACLPIKIFHGHVESIKDHCDLMLVPRIMRIREKEYICPKFCGLPEMILNSIPDMPEITTTPIYAQSLEELYVSAVNIGKKITKNTNIIQNSFNKALEAQRQSNTGRKDKGFRLNIALVGHPYNIYDSFANMNIMKKLNRLGIGVMTEEYVTESVIDAEVKKLFKRPFWTFARNSYGYSSYMSSSGMVDGIVYISSFACGIDSVVIELIKDKTGDFPLLVLKIDEHTGEAGFDTRLEAFTDMLERRKHLEGYISTPR